MSGVDQVRASAHRTRALSNDGAKHAQKTVGLAATTYTVDDKCTQVEFANVTPASVAVVYFRVDPNTAGGGTDITTANGFPYMGQVLDIKGGTVLQLISDTAAQDLRVLETLLA